MGRPEKIIEEAVSELVAVNRFVFLLMPGFSVLELGSGIELVVCCERHAGQDLLSMENRQRNRRQHRLFFGLERGRRWSSAGYPARGLHRRLLRLQFTKLPQIWKGCGLAAARRATRRPALCFGRRPPLSRPHRHRHRRTH